MIKKNEIDSQKQIDSAAELFAKILIQQVLSRRINNAEKIENKYGKTN